MEPHTLGPPPVSSEREGGAGENKRVERSEGKKTGVARPGEHQAGVGGLITGEGTRRATPLRMHACRVVADQEGDSERVREETSV